MRLNKLFASLAMVSAGFASAQPVVNGAGLQIYGRLDASVNAVRNGGTGSATTLSSDTSLLGFRGTEQLGNGLVAYFKLEHGLNIDTGANASAAAYFNRESYVGVGHVRYGYVELGSHWNPAIWLTGRVDPFGRQQMGAIEAILQGTAVRGFLPAMPNSVAYVTPDVGGFRGRAVVQAAEGVVAAGNRALSLDYVNERLYVGLLYDYAQVTGASLGRPGTPALRSKTTAIGATYRFQPVKVHGYVQHNQVEGLPAVNGYMLGASVPMGAGELRASIVKTSNPSATATQVAIGYIHSLSKRTQIYTTAARIENRSLARFALWPSSADRGAANAPLAGQQATGVQVGIRHFF